MEEKDDIISAKDIKQHICGIGPWIDEPDFLSWEYKGIKCLINRAASGYLCGYCEIPKGHSFYEVDVFENHIEVDVHGGLTFGGYINEKWFIGFDCAHSMDICPAMQKMMKEVTDKSGMRQLYDDILKRNPESPLLNRTYKDINFVQIECENLANQILKAAKN